MSCESKKNCKLMIELPADSIDFFAQLSEHAQRPVERLASDVLVDYFHNLLNEMRSTFGFKPGE